ncbi:MAG: hypothetical protein ACREDL_00680, partial [Bradyrhizobium sp.]
MRILIDLQGVQSGSRHRGIGRYAAALAKAIIRNRGDHEVFILLNGLLGDSVEKTIDNYRFIIPKSHILIFSVNSPIDTSISGNVSYRKEMELGREAMINDVAPDILLIMSFFEGATDSAIT